MKRYTTRWESDLAFFGGHKTGPNLVSLPGPTYSSTKGLLRSILGKVEMTHIIHEVLVLSCRGTCALTMNEMKSFPKNSFYTDDQRTTRTYVHLVDVAIAVVSSIKALPSKDPLDTWEKFDHMFTRRMNKGQFHDSAPTLGTKECLVSSFRFTEPGEDLTPLDVTEDLGLQPFDQDYSDPKEPWYYAPMQIEKGVIKYPSWEEVKKLGLRRDTKGAV